MRKKGKIRRKPAKRTAEPVVRQYHEDNGTLRCVRCKAVVIITRSGLICDCPKIGCNARGYTQVSKQFPKQISFSPLDAVQGEK